MTICIEVALKAEATPLIDAFKLKPLAAPSLFPIYEGENLKLIISGIGKVKAGAACAYLAGIHRDEDIYGWLNIGVAGHRNLPIGTPILVNQLIDEAKKEQFFPSFAFDPPCRTEGCITVERAETLYPTHHIYEMEGAGFYPIASKLSPLEMIHLFKVISDNPSHPTTEVTRKEVQSLIFNHLGLIGTILDEMRALIAEIVSEDSPFLEECLKRWHFSTCETLQLKKLLNRWQLLCSDQIFFSKELLEKRSSKEVLQFLRSHLESTPLSL